MFYSRFAGIGQGVKSEDSVAREEMDTEPSRQQWG